MILVFLLFGLFIIIALITYILLLSNIKIKVTKLHILKATNKFEIKFVSKLGLYLLNRIRLFELTIDDDKIKEQYRSGKMDLTKLKYNKQFNKDAIKLLKKIDFTIEELKIKGYIGTENASFTAFVTTFINTIIPILITNKINEYKKENYHYQIDTVYINQNIVNLEFNCIISIKIVHIINILYIYLKKGRVKKNERTSNRRAYAYSHE